MTCVPTRGASNVNRFSALQAAIEWVTGHGIRSAMQRAKGETALTSVRGDLYQPLLVPWTAAAYDLVKIVVLRHHRFSPIARLASAPSRGQAVLVVIDLHVRDRHRPRAADTSHRRHDDQEGTRRGSQEINAEVNGRHSTFRHERDGTAMHPPLRAIRSGDRDADVEKSFARHQGVENHAL